MTYSDDDLKQIEECASVFLPISDIAVILDVPADVLRDDISDRANPAYVFYRRGKVTAKFRIRKQEMDFAHAGSPLAMENTLKALNEMEDDE